MSGSEISRKSIITLRGLVDLFAASTLRTLGLLVVLIGLILLAAVQVFGLTWFGAFALYFVLWWTFLFAVLPLGNQPEASAERIVPGQDPGAPALPRMREKALLTTLIAAVAFFVALLVFPLSRL